MDREEREDRGRAGEGEGRAAPAGGSGGGREDQWTEEDFKQRVRERLERIEQHQDRIDQRLDRIEGRGEGLWVFVGGGRVCFSYVVGEGVRYGRV